jgi:hypothetical protein
MPANPLEQNPTDRQAQNTQYYLRVLHELIELGTELVRVAQQQALSKAEAAPQSPASLDPTPFDIITRSIRRTVILASKLSEPPAPHPTLEPKRTNISKRKEWDGDPARLTDAELREACERERGDVDDKDNLDDLTDDASVADIIADFCRDFGVDDLPDTHPGKRRVVAGIVAVAARAATIMSRDADASSDPPFSRNSPASPIPRVGLVMHQQRPPGSKGTDPP